MDLYGLDGNGDVFNDEGVVCQDVVSDVIAPPSVSEVVACDGTECCSIATDGSGMGYRDVIVGGDTMNMEGVCIIDVKLGLVSRY